MAVRAKSHSISTIKLPKASGHFKLNKPLLSRSVPFRSVPSLPPSWALSHQGTCDTVSLLGSFHSLQQSPTPHAKRREIHPVTTVPQRIGIGHEPACPSNQAVMGHLSQHAKNQHMETPLTGRKRKKETKPAFIHGHGSVDHISAARSQEGGTREAREPTHTTPPVWSSRGARPGFNESQGQRNNTRLS